MTIKAIETRYKGYRFRSRLEARWAVFFDALGIAWEYEAQGFDLNGEWYLPDFWLPRFHAGMFAEVKPDGGDWSKAEALCKLSGKSVWLCEGTPSIRAYTYLYPEDYRQIHVLRGIPNADAAEGENRMFAEPGYENEDMSVPREYWDCLGSTFLNAVDAARSARFEHGERGPG